MNEYKQNYYFEDLKYYKVVAKCGHTGMNNYTIFEYPVCAHTAKEAAKRIRFTGRVKHDRDDAIQSVTRIELDEYNEMCEKNKDNPWLHCECIQDQRRNCPDLVIYKEEDKELRYKYSDDYYEYKKNIRNRYEKNRRDTNRIEYYESRYNDVA